MKMDLMQLVTFYGYSKGESRDIGQNFQLKYNAFGD
jgi:hypothetical protein